MHTNTITVGLAICILGGASVPDDRQQPPDHPHIHEPVTTDPMVWQTPQFAIGSNPWSQFAADDHS